MGCAQKSMDLILDLDLDFFVWPITHMQTGDGRLPDDECSYLASEQEVRCFLEQNCHLSKDSPLPGQQFREHEDAFRVWRRWLREGKLSSPFVVVHVDAHADLGAGINQTADYLETKLLALPVSDRAEPFFGSNGINSGNYLVCAIANRWLRSLTYVYPTGPKVSAPETEPQSECFEERLRRIRKRIGQFDEQPPVEDLPAWCFRNSDWKTGTIELARYRPNHFLRAKAVPIEVEPAIPLTLISDRKFEISDSFTHLVVAQSPQYTTESADRLLPVIAEYFTPA